ncbi:hypothetical protein ACEPAG_2228 [Sanghuangporus baumii]
MTVIDNDETNEVIRLVGVSRITDESCAVVQAEDVISRTTGSDRATATDAFVTADDIGDSAKGIESDVTPTFNEIARTLSRGPLQDTTKDEDVKADAVFYLTPLGSTAPYFASEQKWREVLTRIADINDLDPKKGYADAIKNLYKLTHAAGLRLLTSANGRDARERALAHCAWKTSPPATRSNAEWYHTVMIHMVLDRLIFAFDENPAEDKRPLQIGHMPPFKTPQEMQNIFDKFVHWKETATEFCELWENAYRMKKHEALFPNVCSMPDQGVQSLQVIPAPRSHLEKVKMETAESLDVVQNGPNHTEGDEVIRSLIGGMKETYTTSRVNAIFNNFCITALALRTLILLQESRTFKVGIRKERRLLGPHETVIRHGCDVSTNPTERSGHFEHSAQPNSVVCDSTGVPGLKQSKFRCKIEHAVANVIFEMALHGPDRFEERMHVVIGLIRSTLAQLDTITIDVDVENVGQDAQTAAGESGLDPDVSMQEGGHESEGTVVEENVQARNAAAGKASERQETSGNDWTPDEEESTVGVEARPEVILQKEWIRDLRLRRDSADMKYRLIDKLTNHISPKKPHEKPSRIDFSLPHPPWYMSVMRKVNKMNDKRKRKEMEDVLPNEEQLHAAKRTRVGEGSEADGDAVSEDRHTGMRSSEEQTPEVNEEVGEENVMSRRQARERTSEPSARVMTSDAEDTVDGQVSAGSPNRKRRSKKKQKKNSSKGKRTRSEKKSTNKGRAADSEEVEDTDTEESKDSEEETGPASRLRGKKTTYDDMFDDSDDAIEDWSDLVPDTFGIAYQTDNIWDYEPPKYKGFRIRFENIPEPVYSRALAFGLSSQSTFFGTQASVLETPDREVETERITEGTPTTNAANPTSLPISRHIQWEAMSPKICTTWDKDDLLRSRISPLKTYRGPNEATTGYQTTVVFSKEEWEDMDISIQRRIFSQKNVLIKADLIRNNRRRDADPFETKELARFVDTHSPLQALDCTVIPPDVKGRLRSNTSSYRTVRSSLQEYSKHVLEYESKRQSTNANEETGTTEPSFHVLNFLDIPAGQDIIDVPFDDMSKHLVRSTFVLKQKSFEGDRERRTIYNYSSTLTSGDVGKRWFLASGAAGWSDWHSDAGGMCTFVKINTGTKLWAISHEEDIYPGTWTEDRGRLKMENVDLIILRPGDILYMKPATNHLVMNIEHCLAFGGHFYSFHHMRATMKGIIRDHYIGKSNSNSELLRAPLLLMKAISGIAETLSIVDPHQESDEATDELPTDDVQNVADLLITVIHLDQLAPELPPYTTGQRRRAWQDSPEFKHDFAKVSAPVDHVVNWMSTNDKNGALLQAEEAFRKECLDLQNRLTEKSKRKLANSKIMKFKCVCDDHDVDE